VGLSQVGCAEKAASTKYRSEKEQVYEGFIDYTYLEFYKKITKNLD